MMSESESLEESNDSPPLLNDQSMASGLRELSAVETMKMVRVLADDMQIRCDLLSMVRWVF